MRVFVWIGMDRGGLVVELEVETREKGGQGARWTDGGSEPDLCGARW